MSDMLTALPQKGELVMDLGKAKQIAGQLTEISTTGEDFLAGEMDDGKIVIERYSDENCEEVMPVAEAIKYAGIFAIDGAVKCRNALTFLAEHNCLDTITPTTKRMVELECRSVVGILSNA